MCTITLSAISFVSLNTAACEWAICIVADRIITTIMAMVCAFISIWKNWGNNSEIKYLQMNNCNIIIDYCCIDSWSTTAFWLKFYLHGIYFVEKRYFYQGYKSSVRSPTSCCRLLSWTGFIFLKGQIVRRIGPSI